MKGKKGAGLFGIGGNLFGKNPGGGSSGGGGYGAPSKPSYGGAEKPSYGGGNGNKGGGGLFGGLPGFGGKF